VHFVALNSEEWRNYLLFRELLGSRFELREQYATLKLQLGKRFPSDRRSYMKGKSRFVRATLLKASV